MAVFPDRIVLKNSTDPAESMSVQLNPSGSSPITDGELVIRQDAGFWELYALTSDDLVVSLTEGLVGRASINDLSDVNIAEPIAPLSTLSWNGSEWVAIAPPVYDISNNYLNDLGDVNITLPNDGEVLKYDLASSSYINGQLGIFEIGGVIRPDIAGGFNNGSVLIYQSDAGGTYEDFVTRPLKASELNDDLGITAPTSLGGLSNVNPDVDTSAANNSVLSWDSSAEEWIFTPPGVPDLTLASVGDLSDVNLTTNAPSADGYALIYRNAQAEFVAGPLNYIDIADRPTQLSFFFNDLTVSDFPNDANYLPGLGGSELDDLGDVVFTSLSSGDVLSFDGTSWVNSAAPPADISGSSIRDLNDVSVVNGNLAVSNTSGYALTTTIASNAGQSLFIEGNEDNLDLVATRNTDDQGVRISLSRAEGVRLRSDVEIFRLLGNPNSIGNTPELVWHSGTTTTGLSVSIQLPSDVTQDYTYLLPQSPGFNGQVLALEASTGQTYWKNSSSITELGQIDNVDLLTYPPTTGDVLTYQANSGLWVALPSTADLSVSTLNEISDVGYTTTPTQGQALLWNNTSQQWQPNTIPLNAPESIGDLGDVNTTTNPPLLGQTLVYDTDGNWVPGSVPGTVGNLQLVGDVIYPQPREDRDLLIYSSASLQWENGSILLEDLSDTDLSTPPADGQILSWNSTDWVAVDQIQSIGELGDVDIITNTPADGKFLGWDSNLNAFTPLDAQQDNLVLSDLADVSSSTPANNDILQYSQVTGEWQPVQLPETGSVVISSETQPTTRPGGGSLENGDQWWKTDTNQLFVYEAGAWETFLASSIDDLSDVDTTTSVPTVGQVLAWNGSEWVPGDQTGGSGSSGGSATDRLTETETASSGVAQFTNLGSSGTFVSVTSTLDAWIVFYGSAADRASDSSRAFDEDPDNSSGVFAEFYITAGATVLATPGTTYFNNDTSTTETLYAAVRNQAGDSVDSVVTVTAYGNKALTATSLRSTLGIGEYSSDTAAGAGGVSSGAMYYNTTTSDYRVKS